MAARGPEIDYQIVGLPPLADGAVAIALRGTLLNAARDRHDVLLDASNVDDVSMAVIQVIEAARLSFQAQGRMLALRAPSDAITSAYDDLGLFSSLMQSLAESD